MLARREEIEMADEGARLESRVARIASDVAHISASVSSAQIDLRELRKEVGDGFRTVNARLDAGLKDVVGRIEALDGRLDGKIGDGRSETAEGFEAVNGRIDTLDAKLDRKIQDVRAEMAEGFKTVSGGIDAGLKQARKNLRTDLGLFIAALSLLVSIGLGMAALILKH